MSCSDVFVVPSVFFLVEWQFSPILSNEVKSHCNTIQRANRSEVHWVALERRFHWSECVN